MLLPHTYFDINHLPHPLNIFDGLPTPFQVTMLVSTLETRVGCVLAGASYALDLCLAQCQVVMKSSKHLYNPASQTLRHPFRRQQVAPMFCEFPICYCSILG